VTLKNQNTIGKPASVPVEINERLPTEEDGFDEDFWLKFIINKNVDRYQSSKCAHQTGDHW
jgi:hypothetical protein